MDGGGDLAGGAGHAAVGDQGDVAAAVLQQAEDGGQAVQLGHAVGAGPLEAQHGDEVAVELAALEGGDDLLLVGEADRGRLDHVVLRRHR